MGSILWESWGAAPSLRAGTLVLACLGCGGPGGTGDEPAPVDGSGGGGSGASGGEASATGGSASNTGGTDPGGSGGSATNGAGGAASGGTAGAGGDEPGESCAELGVEFETTLIDSSCNHHAFGLDANDVAHFFFVRGSDAASTATGHYANNRSGTIEKSEVDPEQGRLRNTSLKLDQEGNVHVAYDRVTGSSVSYASNTSGEWIVETVGQARLGGAGSYVAVDGDGNPHVVFNDEDNQLAITTKADGAWTTTIVPGGTVDHVGLWFDDAGSRHLAFDGCGVASEQDDSWFETGSELPGHHCRLARGLDDLHLVFVVDGAGSAPDELNHATQDIDGAWSVTSTVHATALAPIGAPSVAVGRDGTLFVAFAVHDQFVDGCGVHVASFEPGAGGFSVHRVAEYGYDPKLAIDSMGKLHVAYCNGDGLVYAVEPD